MPATLWSLIDPNSLRRQLTGEPILQPFSRPLIRPVADDGKPNAAELPATWCPAAMISLTRRRRWSGSPDSVPRGCGGGRWATRHDNTRHRMGLCHRPRPRAATNFWCKLCSARTLLPPPKVFCAADSYTASRVPAGGLGCGGRTAGGPVPRSGSVRHRHNVAVTTAKTISLIEACHAKLRAVLERLRTREHIDILNWFVDFREKLVSHMMLTAC